MEEINIRLLLELYKLSIKDKYSKNTVKSYTSHIELILKEMFEIDRLDGLTINNLKSMCQFDYSITLKNLQKNRNYSNTTINNKSLAISSFYDFLIEQGYLNENPCYDLQRLDYKEREVLILSKEEINKLKLASDDLSSYFKNDVDFVCSRARAIIYLLVDVGLKTSEILALNDDMIDYENKIITIDNRKITIAKDTARILRRYIKRRDKRNLNNDINNPVFVSNRGKRISKKVLQTVIDIVATECGYNPKDITASSIRASYFINLRNEGEDIKELYKISGYTSEIAFKQYLEELDTIIENSKKWCSLGFKSYITFL